MKYVFLTAFAVLSFISAVDWALKPGHHGTAPVVYWVTDANPARLEQIGQFRRWLAEKGYPDIDMRLDTASADPSKKIIQGVSGVAGDILDLGPSDMPYFVATGLLADVTEPAKRLGFAPEKTYAAIEPLIVQDGRQYRFPCNVYARLLWINKAIFARYNQPLPPARWDWQTFERMGKAFVTAANPPGGRRTVFYVDELEIDVLRRSLGLDTFNETLTRCMLDDPRNALMMRKLRQWTDEDHLLPGSNDSFAVASGYGGSSLQLLNSGNFAMVGMGRHALIQLRQFGNLDLAISEPPHGGFPNTSVGTRAAGVYAGSKYKEQAELFLTFLASEPYNRQIVDDADADPPNPIYSRTEAYVKPPAYPNEWGCHAPFTKALEEIAISASISPFVLPNIVTRVDQEAYNAYARSGRLSAEQSAAEAARRLNAEIARSLKESPALQLQYDQRVRVQAQIDEARAAGRKVPLAWISNPFHRHYYQQMGWAE